MSQTERILFIDRKLRSIGQVTVRETAEHFEVSTRQVKRDIEYLRDRFSAPIIWDSNNKVYRYERTFRDLQFADQKIVMSYVVLKSMSENSQYVPVYSEGTLSNVEDEVPRDYREVCDRIIYEIPQTEAINPDFFMDICTALRDKCCLIINYESIKGESTERCIEPERLLNYSGNWYIIAFDHLRTKLRTFHLSRIRHLRLTTTEQPLLHDAEYEASIKAYISDSFGIFKGSSTQKAVVRFYDTAARIVSHQSWHPSQTLTNGNEPTENPQDHSALAQSGALEQSKPQGREYTQLEFPVADITEVLSKVLAFGPLARPIEPPELCKKWKDAIKAMSCYLN